MKYCLLGIIRNKAKTLDRIVIPTVNTVHSNSCDPFMLVNIFCPEYDLVNTSNCGDEFLRDITVQMAIDPVVNIRVMTELLQKALLERKDIDRHIINNVRIRAHRKN